MKLCIVNMQFTSNREFCLVKYSLFAIVDKVDILIINNDLASDSIESCNLEKISLRFTQSFIIFLSLYLLLVLLVICIVHLDH